MMSIVYYMFMDRTALSVSAMIVLVYGVDHSATLDDLLRTR